MGDDEDEKEAFTEAVEKLWKIHKDSPNLLTVNVRKVETEHKKLKNMIKEKEEKVKALEDKSKELERNMLIERQKIEMQLEQQREANEISQKQYQDRLLKLNEDYAKVNEDLREK